MKRLILLLLAAILLALGAPTTAHADCDGPDPGNDPTWFE